MRKMWEADGDSERLDNEKLVSKVVFVLNQSFSRLFSHKLRAAAEIIRKYCLTCLDRC